MAFTLLVDGESREIEILARKPRLLLRVDGRLYAVAADADGGDVVIDGQRIAFSRAFSGETQALRLRGRTFEALVARNADEEGGAGAGADVVKAPMPGVVVRLQKRAGEAVTRGETVLTIESMKLQTALAAPRDGVIAEVMTQEGGSFEKDAALARLRPAGEE